MNTIAENQNLFKIVTPINVDHLESLLLDHPNRSFIDSVLVGLREGFWPWAEVNDNEYPMTWDNSDRPLKSEEERRFVREQADVKILAGRFSQSFGTELLPGMYSIPIHAVPKPESNKLCLVVDQSAGEFSLNSMIDREDIKGVKLDGIPSLGVSLCRFHAKNPEAVLVMWKSDVSSAYRLTPMHPLWQLKQIITIDGS
jgi:hypothetical protein